MKTSRLILAMLLSILAQIARADNAVPVGTRQIDGRIITFFAHPTPLQAGPLQLAVMVIEQKSGQPDLDWKIEAVAHPGAAANHVAAWTPPCCRMDAAMNADGSVPLHFQSGASSGNGLMQSASLILKKAGSWQLDFALSRTGKPDAQDQITLQVGPPAPPITRYWAWFTAPPLFALGYVFTQKSGRKSPDATPHRPSVAPRRAR